MSRSVNELLWAYKNVNRTSSSVNSQPDLKRQKLDSSSELHKTVNINQKYVVSVIFQGQEGFANSVTHYYHFLFAAVFPLLEYHLQNKGIAGYNIKTDVGPMKQILCELPLNILEIVGPDKTLSRIDATTSHVALPAYDIFVQDIYGSAPLLKKSTISIICKFLSDSVPSYLRSVPTYDIILIERTNAESYYRSLEVEMRHIQSGSMLRSINNHKELSNALTTEFGSRFCNLTLERSSIYYQYHIFSRAKIVIAQHGAALSNIVFMESNENHAVIEIRPPAKVLPQFQAKSQTHFINLAMHVGLRHIQIDQVDDHADVNINEIVSHIKDVMANW